ncbi:hypothetical protein GCM10027517_03840 [Phycicoccus ginsengisoli]
MTDQTEEERDDAATEHKQPSTTPTTEVEAVPAGEDGGHDGSEEAEVGDRQARRYAQTRARLKEVSAERDTLAERVSAYQRADVERIAGRHLSRPDLIWDNGLTLEAVLDPESGTVDADAVEEAVQGIAERLRGALPPPAHHLDLGPKRTVRQQGSSWAGVFKGR